MSTNSEAAPATAEAREASRVNTLMFAKLMPLLVCGYLLNFLDRTNIALAKSALQADLGIGAAAYGLGAGLFFLTYSVCQVPSNLILQRVGARRWITAIVLSWGCVSTAMALVKGPESFYALRVLLGIAEAGMFPGVMFYLTGWFGTKQRAQAIGYFLLGSAFANIIGGPIGGALLSLDGKIGLHGWQWLFLMEGAPAILFAFVVWKLLPDGPATAPWLTKAEADGVLARLAEERALANRTHDSIPVKAVFVNPHLLLAILIYFCHQIALYGVTFFLPAIIRSWGHLGEIQIGMLTALPWLCTGLGTAFLPKLVMARNLSRPFVVTGFALMAISFAMPMFVSPVLALAAFCFGGIFLSSVQSVLFTFPASRFHGAALAAGLGFLNTLGILGGFIGPYAIGLVEQSTGKASNGLLLMSGALVISTLASLFLRYPFQDRAKA